MAGSWVRTIATPFKKVGTLFNPPRDKDSKQGNENVHGMKLEGEVMACGYEDVQVMWSILDKSNQPRDRNRSS